MEGFEVLGKKSLILLSLCLDLPLEMMGINEKENEILINETVYEYNQILIKNKMMPYFTYLMFKLIRHVKGDKYATFKSVRRHSKKMKFDKRVGDK
jgi:hypothetical protein